MIPLPTAKEIPYQRQPRNQFRTPTDHCAELASSLGKGVLARVANSVSRCLLVTRGNGVGSSTADVVPKVSNILDNICGLGWATSFSWPTKLFVEVGKDTLAHSTLAGMHPTLATFYRLYPGFQPPRIKPDNHFHQWYKIPDNRRFYSAKYLVYSF